MEPRDLVGFRVTHDRDLPLIDSVALSLQYGHVAYLLRHDSEASGWYFLSNETERSLVQLVTHQVVARPGVEFMYEDKPVPAQVLNELNKSRVFPLAKLSCGIFLKKRVFLETWPKNETEVSHPLLSFSSKKKELGIKFAHVMDSQSFLRKLVFKFKDLDLSLAKVVRSDSRLTVYFPLVRCPKTCDAGATQKQQYWLCNGSKDPWALSTGCLAESRDLLWQFLANLTVVRLEFDLKFRVNHDVEAYLRSFLIVAPETVQIRDEKASNILPTVTMRDVEASGLSFKLKYLLFCLMSHGNTSCFHLSPFFLPKLRSLNEDYTEYAFTAIYQSSKTFGASPFTFEALFEQYYAEAESKQSLLYEAEKKDASRESHMLRRILVTPSTVYFTLPSRELSNRVTRQYRQYLDRFLRMSFVDERLASLSSPSLPVRIRIANSFLPKFRFFDREYELLSFSSSQLRAGSLWMFSNLPDLTVSDIRNWLGDFSNIKNPAKYSSRVGQCFSNSRHTIQLADSELVPIREIVVETGTKIYTMSDGAGTISPELFGEAASECAWDQELGRAIQIRIGGIKGVASLDPTLTGRKLCYRDSMYKFPSTHRGLEILNFAQFRFGYLNRQIILLLSTLGVKDPVFRKLQNDYLESLKEIFTVPKTLKGKLMVSDSDEAGCPLTVETVKSMLDSGLSPQSDPFLRAVAQALYNRMIMELRQKQRILVNKSACLMGVLDETGSLDYGQTYVRLRYTDAGNQLVEETLSDYVAVTKNPCFHPGDVRKLKVVDVPQLRHHVNVIVFPSKGARPHPNEISGSDLDGDLYFVTWETGLLPRETIESMDFTATGVPERVDEMNSERMKDFFLKFICSDNLGIIANAHLALADESPQKALDERCLKLAKMHSTAVDFAKTGVSEIIPKDLKPKRYPDFMENKNKETYESTKVIGVLYRQARDFRYQPDSLHAPQLVEPHPQLRTVAESLYERYRLELYRVMNIFNVDSEAEVLTGEVAKYSKFYNNNQKKRREETRTKLKDIVQKLTKAMTSEFAAKAGDCAEQLAQECRFVAYTDAGVKYPGFPWVVAPSFLLSDRSV